jgi:hypothetical protein
MILYRVIGVRRKALMESTRVGNTGAGVSFLRKLSH